MYLLTIKETKVTEQKQKKKVIKIKAGSLLCQKVPAKLLSLIF